MKNEPQHFQRTRIAPTPSGYLHPGNAFSFAVTAWLAKQTGAAILLRIDDLDRERVRTEYLRDIFDILSFLNIAWEEGPKDVAEFEATYSQRYRENLYDEALHQLAGDGKLFACACSRSQLEVIGGEGYPGTCRNKNIPLDQPGVSWRIRTEENARIKMKTLDQGVIETALPVSMNDFIVRKKDGCASYQLASLCDDIYFNVDLIVRGEDLFDSTLAQLYLATALGKTMFTEAVFYHHPLLQMNKRKLSKSAGDTSIRYLKERGFTKEDVWGMIAEIVDMRNDQQAGFLKGVFTT